MAGTKFSGFVTGDTTANTLIVGYDSNLNTNNQYNLSQLATGLSDYIPSFYTNNGSLTSNQRRTVTMGGSSSLVFTGGPGGSFSTTKTTWPVGGSYKTAVLTSTTPITAGMTISGQSGVITSVTSVGDEYTVVNTYNFSTLPASPTVLYSNNVTIGDKTQGDGIGWKFTPGEGGANAFMTLSDTNNENILFKYANGNNPSIAKPRIVGLGEQMASGEYDGKGAIAINWPNNYNSNQPWLSASTTDTSGLWVWGGGHRNTATLIGKYGNNNAGNDTDRIFQCIAWPGTAANPHSQRIFTITTDGTVAIGDTANSATYKAATNLKVNGQAYTELYDTANTTLTVDWNNGNVQELTGLTGSHTFTASNPKAGATYILSLAQTGAVTPTWTGIKWPAATAPTLSGNNKTDVITLICYDETGAGLYYGSFTLNFTT